MRTFIRVRITRRATRSLVGMVEAKRSTPADPATRLRRRESVGRRRAQLQKQGLRPVQIWVPDVRAPGFAAEAHRQSVMAAASEHAAEDQAFIDAASVDLFER